MEGTEQIDSTPEQHFAGADLGRGAHNVVLATRLWGFVDIGPHWSKHATRFIHSSWVRLDCRPKQPRKGPLGVSVEAIRRVGLPLAAKYL